MTDLAPGFLTSLEEQEMRLLAWGYVDNAWTADEIAELAEDYALKHDDTGLVTGAQLVQTLKERALLLPVDGGAGQQFRTRMAETVRLLARLRQLFPKHKDARWITAPTLVSDFRVVARPRSYPKRDIALDDALAEIQLETGIDSAGESAIRALLSGRGAGPIALSRFQIDATIDVLQGLSSKAGAGTIVGAGTGSGKTLAFYLPALTHVVTATKGNGTRVLAIYPRTELLRDQFSEAFREAGKLDGVGQFGRPVRIGALYGATPFSARSVGRNWKSRGPDWICPYMACPDCGGRLIWNRADLDSGNPTLHCEDCHVTIGSDRLALTRDQFLKDPPDVLFTTTEMLNRTLMDGRMRRLIGVGRQAMPIDLVLLDEVHTYEGTTGAQVASVLRRWRHARRQPVHFVGLSATLREAGSFFAELTGISVQNVKSIEPSSDDLETEGQEYMIAARADPHSGASVLSSTIQTAMLMQRALDPPNDPRSEGAFGQRLFAFTDDLDVTNRLYFDLLDAEGLDSFGNPSKAPLAALRAPIGGDLQARRAAGQLWDSLEPIGHRNDDSTYTRVGRTTSQDSDVDQLANAVVATASLEVGFNDPRVGAVLQHKAPRGPAAFLQRKGRAGRDRRMRPWTIVMLADFGRDRTTYEAYERLFDPELEPRSLPVANPAVVRMQAVFSTLDWLVDRVAKEPRIWPMLQYPAELGQWHEENVKRQTALAEVLERVLTDTDTRDELAIHLKRALGLSDAAIEEILWQPPRALMTTVIPTAVRRLRSQWGDLTRGPGKDYIGDGPLPEFVVSRLFGDLALPEITVVTPAQTKHEDERREQMRAVQALNAFAPGRVSHRLTISHRYARHWIPPHDSNGTAGKIDIQTITTEFEEIGTFGSGANQTRVVRPLTVQAVVPPPDVRDSSHGRLRWNAEFVPTREPDQILEPPAANPLADLIDKVRFHTHGGLAHVEVRRWAYEAEYETTTDIGTERGTVELIDLAAGGTRVAVGLACDVDAIAIDVPIPPSLLSGRALSPEHEHSIRIERFRDRLRSAGAERDLGFFNAERLADAAVLALIKQALADGTGLEHAYRHLHAGQTLAGEIMDNARGDADRRAPTPLGLTDLQDALDTGGALDQLDEAIGALWDPIDKTWDDWGAQRLVSSIGAVTHVAIQELCPEYDADDVVIDLEQADTDVVRVWLSEQTIGGGGVIQEALRRISDSPRTFFDLIAAATEPSIDEVVDQELTRIARLATDDDDVVAALEAVRDAQTHSDRATEFEALLGQLAISGAFVCHPVVSALSVRALRPGSDARIDAAINHLLEDWDEIQARLELDIDLRTYAGVRAADPQFDAVSGLAAPADNGAVWRAGQISGLLWQRGGALRAQALRTPNPFRAAAAPDPLLLRACMRPTAAAVPVADLKLALLPDGQLGREGEVWLQTQTDDAKSLRRALLEACCTPIESGALLHYPRAAAIRRSGNGLRARLVLDLVGE